MAKLTKDQKKKVQEVVLKRWVIILEEDEKTDGYVEELARVMGHDNVGEVTKETYEHASKVLGQASSWLLRTPEVP